MAFPEVLDSTQQDKVRGYHYDGDQFMLLCSNTVIFAARVNGAATGKTYAQVTFDMVTVGAYTDIVPDMTVYLSKTNDIKKAYFRGRARFDQPANKVASSTILYINENSERIADNDYIFVVEDYALHPKFAVATATTYKKDFNRSYAPPAPVIETLQSAYAGVADPDTDLYEQSFSAGGFAVADGASIASRLYTIPSGVSVVSGSLSSGNVRLSFEASEKEYWIHHKITDTNGQATTMHIPVWSIPADLSTTIALGFEGAKIDGSMDAGYVASVNAFEGIEDILDQTLAVIFEREYYDGEEGSIVTPIKFVGRFRKDASGNHPDETASRVLDATFDIEGIHAQLARTNMEHIRAILKSSASVWDEISKLTPWRAVCHFLATHTTFFSINSLTIDDRSNAYLYTQFVANGQSVMDAIKDVLVSVTSNMEWAQSGEARLNPDVRYLDPSLRDGIDILLDLTIDDAIDVALEYQHIDEVGQISAAGGSYSSANGQELIVQAKWPGITAGEGSRSETFNRNILAANLPVADAKSVLMKLSGYHAAILNTRFILTAQFPDQYNWITPSFSKWYTWTLSVEDQDGLRHDFDTSTRWLAISTTVEHDNITASKPTVQVVFICESEASDAQDYDPPASGATPPANPTIPPDNVYPTWPDIPILIPPDSDPEDLPPYVGGTTPQAPAPQDGSVQIAVTQGMRSRGWVTRNGLLSNSVYVPLDPPLVDGEIVTDMKFSGLFLDAYYLANNGTTSHVYYIENVLFNQQNQNWQISEDIDGVYTQLAVSDTDGHITIKGGATGGGATVDYDFTASNGGWVNGPLPVGTYSGGVGWIQTDHDGISDPENEYTGVYITHSAPGSTITAFSVEYTISTGTIDSTLGNYIGLDEDRVATQPQPATGSGSFTLSWTGSQAGVSELEIAIFSGFNQNDNTPPGGTVIVEAAHVTYGTISGFKTRTSTDHGATFDAEVTVGTTDGGMDSEKIGDPVLVGTDGLVRIASTVGGSFSDYGDPIPDGASPSAIFISRLEFGSTSVQNIETITPEFLLGSSVLSDDDEALWRAEDAGTNYVDITPISSGDPGTVPDNSCIHMPWRDGRIILGIFDFDGTRKLGRSTNGGSGWSISSALDDDARCLVTIVNDKNSRQAWFASSSGIGYLSNYRSSLTPVYKLLPTDDPVILVDVYL